MTEVTVLLLLTLLFSVIVLLLLTLLFSVIVYMVTNDVVLIFFSVRIWRYGSQFFRHYFLLQLNITCFFVYLVVRRE